MEGCLEGGCQEAGEDVVLVGRGPRFQRKKPARRISSIGVGESSPRGCQEQCLVLYTMAAWSSSDGRVSEEDNSSDEPGGPWDEDGLHSNERNHRKE